MDNKSIIDVILKVAGFTYGPLLGLFMFGILTKRIINDAYSRTVCIVAPLVILLLDFFNNNTWYAKQLRLSGAWIDSLQAAATALFGTYHFGIELLLINALLTFAGLFMISKKGLANAY